jgi:hypothetical protein
MDNTFRLWREVRAGLSSLSPNANIAKGQLAASTMLALQVKPHIIHVVGFCEGDHAATPSEVIESCQIVRGVIHNCIPGLPEMVNDRVMAYKKELLEKAHQIIEQISVLSADALIKPEALAIAVRQGILKAPQIMEVALESSR